MKKISVLLVCLVCLSISAYSQFRNSALESIIPNLQELSSETEQDIIVEKLYEALSVSGYPMPEGYLSFKVKNLVAIMVQSLLKLLRLTTMRFSYTTYCNMLMSTICSTEIP